jgi:hypothetical protein
MLAQEISAASHAREDQSSPDVFAPRNAHWANAAIGLLSAAKVLTNEKDVTDLSHAELHQAVLSLSAAVARAEQVGLTLNGALQIATGTAPRAQFWSVINDRFSSGSICGLIRNNDWLRPGDYVYQAQTIVRHKLTDSDFVAAGVPVDDGAA